MSLSMYKKKRNFLQTPEPAGGEKAAKNGLRFVVQKHDASALHYDFRLQMEGVLKSWAVPKGPSLNPADKRLAMLVEDHPFDYRNFEGIIPEGNYGAGTVIVWDEGTYELYKGDGLPVKQQEATLLKDLEAGSLKIVLHGKKLKGAYTLFQLKRDKEGKQWLLVKKKDEWATEEDITTKDASVISGKTIAQVAAENGTAAKHPEAPKKTAAKKSKAPAAAVKKESKKPTAKKESTAKKETASKGKSNILTAGMQLDWQAEKDQQITLNGQALNLTSLNKLYWKGEGIAKGEMINYYLKAAPFILPYLLNRPQSLNRHPNGVGAAHFYQKNVEGKVPGWIKTHKDFSESTDVHVQYLVCDSEAALIYMANLGCIEMNPWHARVQSVARPDWCLIDLDPDTKNTYDQVVETALVIKQILDSIGAESYPKTSGSTGLHIYIPLGAQHSYHQSKQLAELVVTLAQKELPKTTSLARTPAKRKGKIYLDFLQNKETQTAAAPYSLRPRPGAPVSTPLHWDEVKKGLTARTYHIHNIFDRLQAEGDLFTGVLGKGINLQKVLEKVEALVG